MPHKVPASLPMWSLVGCIRQVSQYVFRFPLHFLLHIGPHTFAALFLKLQELVPKAKATPPLAPLLLSSLLLWIILTPDAPSISTSPVPHQAAAWFLPSPYKPPACPTIAPSLGGGVGGVSTFIEIDEQWTKGQAKIKYSSHKSWHTRYLKKVQGQYTLRY